MIDIIEDSYWRIGREDCPLGEVGAIYPQETEVLTSPNKDLSPLLRFDRFVFKEKDGRFRLLFESGSSYIYVWINDKYEILCFQFLISGFTGLHYHECGSLQTNTVSRLPVNRALSGPTDLSEKDALERLSHFKSKEFPGLIHTLSKLARKEISGAKLSEKEQKSVACCTHG